MTPLRKNMGQVAQIPCGHCGTFNDPSDQFCANCGYLMAGGPTGTIPVISNPNAPTVLVTSVQRITGTLAPGELLGGRYSVVEMVGKGGFGAVYKATDERFQGRRVVAIKEMSNGLGSSTLRCSELLAYAATAHYLPGHETIECNRYKKWPDQINRLWYCSHLQIDFGQRYDDSRLTWLCAPGAIWARSERRINPLSFQKPSQLNPNISKVTEQIVASGVISIATAGQHSAATHTNFATNQASFPIFSTQAATLPAPSVQPSWNVPQTVLQMQAQASASLLMTPSSPPSIYPPSGPGSTTPGQPRMSRRALLIGGLVATGAVLAGGVGASRFFFSQSTAANTVSVNLAYSTEKDAWLTAAAQAFNNKNIALANSNKIIQVTLGDSGSLDVGDKIYRGESKPIAWSPASDLELQRLDYQWKQKYGQNINATSTALSPRSLVSSPLVFAVWKDRAATLLQKYQKIDWDTIHSALLLPNGWGDLGQPAWGSINLGQTRSNTSNSGLLAIMLMVYAYTRKQILTPELINDPNLWNYIGVFEKAVNEFGLSSGTYFTDTVIANGSEIISTGANDTPPLVNSPVVIAMWKSEATALGWPNQPISWSQIAKLSTGGWSAVGHPELTSRFGVFKFGHTRPDSSNSGLDAVIAENYAGSGEQRPLTLSDEKSSQTNEFVSNVESSIIYYGDNSNQNSTGFFASKMFCNGPTYLSAAVMYENLVIEGNKKQITDNGKACHPTEPVVAIYPSEGTFYSDHPFVIPQASWVTPAKKAAAETFRNFLRAPSQQQKALQYGFRPALPNITIGAPISVTNGVDPRQAQAILNIPTADVVQAVQTSWENLRRKVDIMLILDRSGSMNDNGKIGAAKQGLTEFVSLLGNLDGIGLTTFSDTIDVQSHIQPVGPNRQKINDQINAIEASGNTRLYDTIDEQVKALGALQTKHIKVVVVLTDGMDDASSISKSQLIDDIETSGTNAGEGIKVFTIAYGNDADFSGLTQIASSTGGQEYSGSQQNIRQVYYEISQFF